MVTEGGPVGDGQPLEIVLDAGYLPVSNLSSLLRVLQAALRDVARGDDRSSDPFAEVPHPVLRISTAPRDEGLILRFAFFDELDSNPMTELSERAFGLLLDQLAEFIKRLPQRGLWGESVAGARAPTDDSGVTKRLDQLRVELKRFGKARVRFAGRAITFEGDRMELN